MAICRYVIPVSLNSASVSLNSALFNITDLKVVSSQ